MTASQDDTLPSVEETVFRAIKDHVSVSSAVGSAWVDGLSDATDAVLEALRSLPVEQRAAAVGLIGDYMCRGTTHDRQNVWMEPCDNPECWECGDPERSEEPGEIL